MFRPTLTSIMHRDTLYKYAFLYLLYSGRSSNNISLIICLWHMASASLQLKNGIETDNSSVVAHSVTNVVLFGISSGYIVRNKLRKNLD
jgi:hypothetical protein